MRSRPDGLGSKPDSAAWPSSAEPHLAPTPPTKDTNDPGTIAVAHAAGQAVATAHVPQDADGARTTRSLTSPRSTFHWPTWSRSARARLAVRATPKPSPRATMDRTMFDRPARGQRITVRKRVGFWTSRRRRPAVVAGSRAGATRLQGRRHGDRRSRPARSRVRRPGEPCHRRRIRLVTPFRRCVRLQTAASSPPRRLVRSVGSSHALMRNACRFDRRRWWSDRVRPRPHRASPCPGSYLMSAWPLTHPFEVCVAVE